MPKVTIKSLTEALETNRQLREAERINHVSTMRELDISKKRVAEIAAENESLRMDKKWLQQVHSALLQSIRFSGAKAI